MTMVTVWKLTGRALCRGFQALQIMGQRDGAGQENKRWYRNTSGLSFLIPLARSFSQPLFSQGSRSPLGSERNVWKTWLIVAQCTFKMLVLQAKEYLAQSGPNEEGNLLAHDWKLHGRICFRQAASQQLCHSLPFSLSVFFFFFLFLLTALAICCGTLVFSSCGTQNVLLAEHRF